MIVYGDPASEVRLHALAASLAERCAATTHDAFDALSAIGQLDLVRRLLIDVGRLEQAGTDHLERAASQEGAADNADGGDDGGEDEAAFGFRDATDAVAEAFCTLWERTQHAPSPPGDVVRRSLQRARRALEELLRAVDDADVVAKVPEGFAFYTLYPEQHCVAAHRWADDHASAVGRGVAVIGVRSIGTTQSALVATILRARGWRAERRTVRPVGAPFDRSAHLRPGDVTGADWGLVVDEGPGISGSSMAAVGRALEEAGLSASSIGFLPGHAGEPGPMASEPVRRRWVGTARYVAEVGSLRWEGRALPELLASSTTSVIDTRAAVTQIDDLGAGAWRAATYADDRHWPPAGARFERAKYRCTSADGRAVLWKFFGVDEEIAFQRAEVLFELGWGPRPLGYVHGFVATEWVFGSPSTSADAVACLDELATYVHQAAGEPLDGGERSAGVARLAEVLYWNTHEALGPTAADRSRSLTDAAVRQSGRTASATYGDGSMAPHGWLRDRTGRLRKVGGVGHDRDHTVVGRQAVAWDVAGTITEWGLDRTARERLVRSLATAHPELLVEPWLRFHELAYAAFRLGHTTMAAATGPDPAEDQRVARAAAWYRARLTALLDGT